MEKVKSIEQLNELILGIRNLHQGFVTNFYLDTAKHEAWIHTGRFEYEQYEDTVFLFFDHNAPEIENYFTNLFYISTSIDTMLARLEQYPERFIYDLYIMDIVGRDIQCQPIVERLKAMKGKEAACLGRMTRVGEPDERLAIPGKRVVYAQESDISQIEELLHAHFDEQIEQLPLREELEQMAAEKHILRSVRNGQTAGVLLFDKNATTIYLRYWLVLPESRDQGVGSELLRQFLWEGRETKRQILWVNQENTNAIKRYAHYGFKQENMYDYIVAYCG